MNEAEVEVEAGINEPVVVDKDAVGMVAPNSEPTEAGFPGEDAPEGVPKVDAKIGPWMVAVVNEELIENGVVAILDIVKCELSLQVEADQWIKDNASEGEVYMSLRRGNAFRAKVVRKLEEI